MTNTSDQQYIRELMQEVPHRFPFLLVDRVLDCQPGKSITALKNVTINEPFFTGHFPSYPVMPGVIILESLAQAGLILGMRTAQAKKGTLVFLTGVEKARFKRQILPGDQMILKVELGKMRSRLWRFSGEVWVGDELACKADMMASPGKNDVD